MTNRDVYIPNFKLLTHIVNFYELHFHFLILYYLYCDCTDVQKHRARGTEQEIEQNFLLLM